MSGVPHATGLPSLFLEQLGAPSLLPLPLRHFWRACPCSHRASTVVQNRNRSGQRILGHSIHMQPERQKYLPQNRQQNVSHQQSLCCVGPQSSSLTCIAVGHQLGSSAGEGMHKRYAGISVIKYYRSCREVKRRKRTKDYKWVQEYLPFASPTAIGG